MELPRETLVRDGPRHGLPHLSCYSFVLACSASLHLTLMLGRYFGKKRVDTSKRSFFFFFVNPFHLGIVLPPRTAGYHCSICGLAFGGFWLFGVGSNALGKGFADPVLKRNKTINIFGSLGIGAALELPANAEKLANDV